MAVLVATETAKRDKKFKEVLEVLRAQQALLLRLASQPAAAATVPAAVVVRDPAPAGAPPAPASAAARAGANLHLQPGTPCPPAAASLDADAEADVPRELSDEDTHKTLLMFLQV